jgi:hypothetical protein
VKRAYAVVINCPSGRIQSRYRIVSTSPGRAWDRALPGFYKQHPEVLERGLTFGGDVQLIRDRRRARALRLYAVQLWSPQLKARRAYGLETFSRVRAWECALERFCTQFPAAAKPQVKVYARSVVVRT